MNNASYYIRYFVPAVVVTLSLFFFIDNLLYKSSLAFVVDDQSKKLDLKKAYFSNYFEPSLEDIELLANQSSLKNYLENSENEQELLIDYVLLSEIHKSYVQIRIIDDSGMELVRVDRTQDSSFVIPENQLQDKSNRPYFQETMKHNADQIYVSDIELNQENGVIELPLRPVLRLAKPLFAADGTRKGIIITNYNANTFLKDFSAYYEEGEEFFFLNSDGYFLTAPSQFPLWGFMFSELQEDNFSKYFPEVWSQMQRSEKGYTVNDDGLFMYEEIRFTGLNYSTINPNKIVSDNSWIIATYLDKASLEEILFSHRNNLILALIFFEAIIFTFLFFLAKNRKVLVQRDAELIRLNKDLSTKNEELKQFIYISSHDLKEPLRTIGSYTQILSEEYKSGFDDDGKRFLTYISKSADRLLNLVRGILQYSSLGNSSEREEVDLNVLVKEILEDLEFSIQESDAKIEVQNLHPVVGLKMELRILFQNLISNSIKFRSKDTAPRIEIKSVETNHKTIIYVSDNGIGIDEKYKQKVFQIFQRLHTNNEYPGNGIGLGLCKKIMEIHEGEISFSPNKQSGTTFKIEIPK